MEIVRLLKDPPASGAVNMATDEALLNCLDQGKGTPTLRFYSWSIPTLSVGRFQKLRNSPLLQKARQLKIGVVRRPTGGRGVLHDHEVTYSMVLPRSSQLGLAGSVKETYQKLSQAMMAGFKHLGISPSAVLPSPNHPEDPKWALNSPFCFASHSIYEIKSSAKKVLGSAQLRKEHCFLQHGSLLLTINAPLHEALFSKKELSRAEGVFQISDREFSKELILDSLVKGFEEFLQIRFLPGDLDAGEKKMIQQLVKEKYDAPGWTFSR